MKKRILLLILTLFILTSTVVLADGGMIPSAEIEITLAEQNAVIWWDGTEETLLLSTKATANELTDIAWVIPIQSKVKPEVEEGNLSILKEIPNLFQIDYSSKGLFGSIGGFKELAGVEIIERKKIDIYDITILKTNEGDSLVNWLNENGYFVDTKHIPLFQEYANKKDMYFIANKINFEEKYFGINITPSYNTCAEKIPSHYLYRKNTQEDLDDLKQIIKEDQTESCEGIFLEAVINIAELKNGVATPLEIIFQPEEAFYPQKISSINPSGFGTWINVYLIANSPMEDTNNILDLKYNVELNEEWKNKLHTSLNYATKLTFNGNSEDLIKDSIFVEKEYDDTKNPEVINLQNAKRQKLGRFLSAGIVGVLIWILFCLIPLGVAKVIQNISKKVKNKRLVLPISIMLVILGAIIIGGFQERLEGIIVGLIVGAILASILAISYYLLSLKYKRWAWKLFTTLFLIVSLILSYIFL